jgi:hypothetical protein
MRILFTFILFAAVACFVEPATAQEPVFLRGHRVTRDSTVFGAIDRLAGATASINLGYAHGVEAGELFLAIRVVDGELIPVCGLTVTEAHASYSLARSEGPFRARQGDFVVTRADQLDLWEPTTRLERLARERLARRTMSAGYNTFDISADLVDEVGRDDDFQEAQHRTTDWEAFILAAAEKTEVFERRAGAVEPEPLLAPTADAELAAKAADNDPTIESLSTFAALGRNPELLVPRLDLQRLRRLRPLDSGIEVDEATAPLLRNVLLTWTRKVLKNPTETFEIAPEPPARSVTVPY